MFIASSLTYTLQSDNTKEYHCSSSMSLFAPKPIVGADIEGKKTLLPW